LSGPGADELLHLTMDFMNSSLKNRGYSSRALSENFKNINIDMMILCKIECEVEGIPKVIDF